MWTAIGVAIRDEAHHDDAEQYVKWLRACGAIESEEEPCVVADAVRDVGSAGSLLNALLVTVERLCAIRGYPVLSDDVLHQSSILIVLPGELHANAPFGRAFERDGEFVTDSGHAVPSSPFLTQIRSVTQFARGRKGVWVMGTNSVWKEIVGCAPIDEQNINAFTIKVDHEMAAKHGVYTLDREGFIRSLSYRGECGDGCPLVLSLLYFPPSISSLFLSLHSSYPLSRSTYHGLDTGCIGLKLSLFFDVILSTCGLSEEEYLSTRLAPEKTEGREDLHRLARVLLLRRLRNIRSRAVFLDLKDYEYLEGKPSEDEGGDGSSFFHDMRDTFVAECVSKMADALRGDSAVLPLIRPVLLLDGGLALCLTACQEAALSSPCRALSLVSELLWLASRRRGGLRCGPAANEHFVPCIRKMADSTTFDEGLREIFAVLQKWLDTPQRMVRAARHFEAASQVFIRKKVMAMCEKNGVTVSPQALSSFSLVRVRIASRVDLFGGWLDTPPITFDVPAAVVNIAILVEGELPIACEVTVTDKETVRIEEEDLEMNINDIWERHDKPGMTGSLHAACLVASGVLPRGVSLSSAFSSLHCHAKGLSVKCVSAFAQGSGMGSSSILASALLSAIWTLFNIEHTNEHIIHTVLLVEQLLTTGGGWQDQVGGVYPALKMGFYDEKHEAIRVKEIPIERRFKEEIERRMAIVYTGQARLAKNLLQEVIRDWIVREGNKAHALIQMSKHVNNVVDKLEKGVFPVEYVREYYDAKKTLATGCEPSAVSRVIALLSEFTDVCWLAGAGGGGYLCVWMKEHLAFEEARAILNKEGLSLLRIQVADRSLEVTVR